jgi:hypothetical protein
VHQTGAGIDEHLTLAAAQLHATRVAAQTLVRGQEKRVGGTGTPKFDAEWKVSDHCAVARERVVCGVDWSRNFRFDFIRSIKYITGKKKFAYLADDLANTANIKNVGLEFGDLRTPFLAPILAPIFGARSGLLGSTLKP